MRLDSKYTLIYSMDPHCGWCFGFADVINRIYHQFSKDPQFSFSVVTGGLFYPRITTSSDFAEDKRPIAKQITKLSGAEFSDAYFDSVIGEASFLDSEIPSRVLNTVSDLNNSVLFPFMLDYICEEFFYGKNISIYNNAIPLIEKYGFDPETFLRCFNSPEIIAITLENFSYSRRLGAGFPTLLLSSENKTTKLMSGYLSFSETIDKIKALVE